MTSKFLVLVFVIQVVIVQSDTNCQKESHTIVLDGSWQTITLTETKAGQASTFKCGGKDDKEVTVECTNNGRWNTGYIDKIKKACKDETDEGTPSTCPEETNTIELDGSSLTFTFTETEPGETFTLTCGGNEDKEATRVTVQCGKNGEWNLNVNEIKSGCNKIENNPSNLEDIFKTAEKICENHADTLEKIKALIEKAEKESRQLTDEENARYLEYTNNCKTKDEGKSNDKEKKCPQLTKEMPGLIIDHFVFDETSEGAEATYPCGDNGEMAFIKCGRDGVWMKNTLDYKKCSTQRTDDFNDLIEEAKQLCRSPDRAKPDAAQYEEIINQLKSLVESDTKLAQKDTSQVYQILKQCSEHSTMSSDTRESTVDSIMVMAKYSRDAGGLNNTEKSDMVDMVENLSKSMESESDDITKDSIVMRVVKKQRKKMRKKMELDVPNTIPERLLPIMLATLDEGDGEAETQANIAVLDQKYYDSILPMMTTDKSISSPIVSLNFMGTEPIKDLKFELDFPQDTSNDTEASLGNMTLTRTCVYLNLTTATWESNGCETEVMAENGTCRCTCNHTTSFAVLLSLSPTSDDVAQVKREEILGYVASTVSIPFLLTTLALVAPFKKLRSKHIIFVQLNMILGLLLFHVSFTTLSVSTQVKYDENDKPGLAENTGCIAGLLFTQYFILSTVCWMGCITYTFYSKIVRAVKSYGTEEGRYLVKCCVAGWGSVSLVFPVATFVVYVVMEDGTYNNPYIGLDSDQCWVLAPWSIAGLTAPILFILLVNTAGFVFIGRVVISKSSSNTSGGNTKTMVALVVLAATIGLPWVVLLIFGLFESGQALGQFTNYLFIVFLGLQGPAMFYSIVCVQKDIRDHTLRLLGWKRKTSSEAASTSGVATTNLKPRI